MNNFEKWRQEISLEELASFIEEPTCSKCPGKAYCIDDKTCYSILMDWGKQEGKCYEYMD